MSVAPAELLQIVVSVAISTPAVAALLGWLGKRRLDQELAQHNRELETLKAGYTRQLETYKAELDASKRLLQAEIDKTESAAAILGHITPRKRDAAEGN